VVEAHFGKKLPVPLPETPPPPPPAGLDAKKLFMLLFKIDIFKTLM
jgi:hypothetical protein